MFKLYITEAIQNKQDPDDGVVWITDDFPSRGDMIEDLLAMGYTEGDVEKVRSGGPRGWVEAANGDDIQWADTEYRGETAVSDLTLPVERLDRIVEAAKRDIARWIESGQLPDTVLNWVDACLDYSLGGLDTAETADVEGVDYRYVTEQVENWLWDGRPSNQDR
ncbi:hypothetical protein CU254_41870 (plasmid) [Amycolatopsis sp. AA4]|uniref:hypothetical protein n=1 Tax=Actinomycetes TaxID=1760 RepID=UPI0001B5713A|nr:MULTISPECIES: hypothetical protein [Actinomycetes]ATY17128.1 hypothetical protein CU254_41870 [Amycolatopsis sp. AA4]EFL12641.1 predicted protein [Streptomyces sp. AA4]